MFGKSLALVVLGLLAGTTSLADEKKPSFRLPS
jgi:hypothetical protein